MSIEQGQVRGLRRRSQVAVALDVGPTLAKAPESRASRLVPLAPATVIAACSGRHLAFPSCGPAQVRVAAAINACSHSCLASPTASPWASRDLIHKSYPPRRCLPCPGPALELPIHPQREVRLAPSRLRRYPTLRHQRRALKLLASFVTLRHVCL